MGTQSGEFERYISIWAKAVETQMHFNEMSVKSRQLGLTFVAAALGVAVVLLSRGDDFVFIVNLAFFQFRLHIAVLLTLGAWFALVAVRELDLNVYHKMLRGAVTFGEDFEENYMKKIFTLEKGMTQAISHFSRYEDANNVNTKAGPSVYTGSIQVTAADKIRTFYRKTIYFLWFASAMLFLVTNINFWIETYSGSPSTLGVTPAQTTESPTEATGEQSDE